MNKTFEFDLTKYTYAQLNEFVESMKKIIKNKGACVKYPNSVDCTKCIGSNNYNESIFCPDNGFSSVNNTTSEDPVRVQNAKNFIEALRLHREGIKPGDIVWVSDSSTTEAIFARRERIFLANVGGIAPIICVHQAHQAKYLSGDKDYAIYPYKYAVKPIAFEPEKKKITIEVTDDMIEQLKAMGVKI